MKKFLAIVFMAFVVLASKFMTFEKRFEVSIMVFSGPWTALGIYLNMVGFRNLVLWFLKPVSDCNNFE